MPRIRCTYKLLKLLGKEATATARADVSEESDLDWYANLFHVDGRKCLIFTNVGTLASFVALDVLKKDVADLPSFFRGRYRDFLGSLQATAHQIEHELESYLDLEIGKSSNRSVLGCMTEFMRQSQYSVESYGGVGRADAHDVSAILVRMPMGYPNYVHPIDELAKRIPGIGSEADPGDGGEPPVNALSAFIDDTDAPIGKLGYFGMRGFFFAVLTSPDMVSPSEAIEALLESDRPKFRDQDQASEVFDLILTEYNEVNQAILDGVGVRPDQCPLRPDAMANFDPAAPGWAVVARFHHRIRVGIRRVGERPE